MTPEFYAARLTSMRDMIRDNGVTYNVYDEAQGHARPWELDMVPFVIGPEDWKTIAAGVAQRARLSDLLLKDIYGPQKMIAEGHIPPHLVLGHPQFLRPLMGTTPKNGVHVHLYSADLARNADGSWIVLSSRADAPSGLGYALENRIVISQTFPDLFRDLQVERLASFFHAYREHVLALAGGDKGRAVLLTPGAYNEAYFEHAYLAHYLGLSLVEGQDLVVRDGQVFLKTLAGLERVGVIFRRLDSDFCDPLEFRARSTLGVPGLAEAVRAGNVVLANALGGGVIESPGMNAYLPNAARALLGEDLAIPDIPTVWCGTEWGRAEAQARLRDVVVRDTFDARQLFWRGSSARLGAELTAGDATALAGRMERRGATFVVQDIASLGLAPVYENAKLIAKPASLRVFAAWTPDGYVVMPGALTRVAQSESIRALSMQSGAASKDTWILSGDPVDNFSLLKKSDAPLPIRRTGDEAPSRAMDNLFWLGRYAERAENLVRVLRAIVRRLADGTADGQSHRRRHAGAPPVAAAEPGQRRRARRREGRQCAAVRRIAEPDLFAGIAARLAAPVAGGAADILVGARSPVVRYLAHGPCLHRRSRTKRSAEILRCRRREFLSRRLDPPRRRFVRSFGGKHDARQQLAVPRYRPADRTRPAHRLDDPAIAGLARQRSREHPMRARDRRQRHDLSLSLSQYVSRRRRRSICCFSIRPIRVRRRSRSQLRCGISSACRRSLPSSRNDYRQGGGGRNPRGHCPGRSLRAGRARRHRQADRPRCAGRRWSRT